MFGYSLTTLIALAVGAIGALTIEHGWGWVLAKYHAYRAQAQKAAGDVYAEVQAQTKGLQDAVTGLGKRLSDVEAAVKDLKGKLP